MSITLIAAMDHNRLIGYENKMPWHLPAEMAYFKKQTTGKVVVMGRKTYDSIGRPLPNRKNVILTRQQQLSIDGCEIVHSVDAVVERYKHEPVMVIGGAEVYSLLLPVADKLLLTRIDAELSQGDAYFPALNDAEWQLKDEQFRASDDRNIYSFTIQTYERI